MAEAVTHGGLVRRIPGSHISAGVSESDGPVASGRFVRDPEAERAALNDYLSGIARGDDEPGPAQTAKENV